jgi:hypothetical protein
MENRTINTCCITITSDPLLAAPQAKAIVREVLRPGKITSATVEHRLKRLAQLFGSYVDRYPHGCWRRGLVLTADMHRLTELYLPLVAVWPCWRDLCAASITVALPDMAAEFLGSASWLGILHRLDLAGPMAPHLLLQHLLCDENLRENALFSWQLPRQHGGGFNRYPAQMDWLVEWLRHYRQDRDTIACLDAACGSGEGTYELTAAVQRAGFAPVEMTIYGSTLQPLEVVAASLAYFPHDHQRQTEYRQTLAMLLPRDAFPHVVFCQEDLANPVSGDQRHAVILCNGLLGGPMLHDPVQGLAVVRGLAARLESGGLLLADDCFHAGWRCRVPISELRQWFAAAGLRVLDLPSGVGGVAA